MSYKEQLDMNRIPEHIAIIMDGNGRWAKQRGKERSFGHQEGISTVHKITEACVGLGVKYLTLYTFSIENWKRPTAEVETLMKLLLENLEEGIFMRNNVRFQAIGDIERLPKTVQEFVNHCIERTANNTSMVVTLALSYSSRWELTHTAKQMVEDALAGKLKPEEVTEDYISQHLATNFMPDPDLLIRTGGELRISNYLLWQCAYSEFYFCDTYWPDFEEEELCKAIVDYQSRERRFGKTGEQIVNNANQNAE